ncbi:MAG: uracil-DNA glycosylase [Clostridia bacterium]|nr:uracil-DNA glycosylase [Clostridia bacterium]
MSDMMESFNARCISTLEEKGFASTDALVFGEGESDSPRILLIGEAPGEQETLQKRPFVGKAGKNLDEFLAVVGLNRPELWITNVVKIRPTKCSEKGRLSNRPPNREELALFTPFLYEELLLLKPRLIVTLGNTPLKALLGKGALIGDHHGSMTQAIITHGAEQCAFPVYPLYHPASIIYNRSLKDVYLRDLENLRSLLG